MAANLRFVMDPTERDANFRPSARAMDLPTEVLPTPGGPTKQRIGLSCCRPATLDRSGRPVARAAAKEYFAPLRRFPEEPNAYADGGWKCLLFDGTPCLSCAR